MLLRKLDCGDMDPLAALHRMYKQEIGEDIPNDDSLKRLAQAIADGRIRFFGAFCDEKLVGCCSVCRIFSTFDYSASGVFEDFFVLPGYRRRGIARALADFAFEESGVSTLLVGCADCDTAMYTALGFNVPLGNMLARTGS